MQIIINAEIWAERNSLAGDVRKQGAENWILSPRKQKKECNIPRIVQDACKFNLMQKYYLEEFCFSQIKLKVGVIPYVKYAAVGNETKYQYIQNACLSAEYRYAENHALTGIFHKDTLMLTCILYNVKVKILASLVLKS